MMFEIKFRILHKGCWMQNIHKRFKGKFVSHITFSLDKKSTSDIVHVLNNNNKEFKDIISYFKHNRQIKKLDFLYQDDKNLYLQIYTNLAKTKSIIGIITKFGGYVQKPIIIDKGWEIWKQISLV